ncbi:glycoside hydrolase family 25 protein [Aureimonas psammosilenae]|uniref:glycoside hydrolase family 25 protein n=1 Tax=Aureimonas psammosilenae TaxID=2495496 RepID=UPI001260876F|nr:glycoside hydrolase family 25 protein [Aureimonas psammosilenae]
MPTFSAVRSAAITLGLSLVCAGLALGVVPAKAAWDKPWQSADRALVIDAYEFNPIDWKELTSDKRIVGFVNKASDGLPPDWNCRGKKGDDELLCKNRWWKYSVTQELYMTRRAMAKELGLKWGAYHLGRPGNPREQADHFIDFTKPGPDELIALDIEDNTSEWMSLADAEIFAQQVFIRTGRYPVLYTNGSTAKWISDYKEKYKLLSRLPLWYARYRDDITGKFPENTWPSYALWQFSSMHNCSTRKCPYRIKGAKNDIDVNVSPLDVAGLRAAWPFNELVRPLDEPKPNLVASLGQKAGGLVTAFAGKVAEIAEPGMRHVEKVIAGEVALPNPPAPAPVQPASAPPETKVTTLISAYGPAEERRRPVLDPLQLLTETARREKEAARSEGEGASFDKLEPEMKKVAAIAAEPAKAVAAPAPKESSLDDMAKSRIRAWLGAADPMNRRSVLALPVVEVSQMPATSTGRADRLGSRLSADSRVSDAFVATR